MITNREKINKMSNEEFAEKFNIRGQNCEVCAYYEKEHNYCHSKEFSSKGKGDDCIEGFIKWLSQEAEEDTVHIPNIGKMPKTDKKVELTEQAYKDILARLDKLEESEYHNAMAIERLEKINEYESNVDDVETKTADQMFEELNYSKEDTNSEWIRYCKLSEDGDYDYDSIKINKKTYLYYKESVREKFDKRRACGITEAEDKAIHKKISELKEELKNESN